MNPMEWQKAPFSVSTDPSRLDLKRVHAFLSASYWAQGIPFEVVQKSVQNSLCFGLYRETSQIGFARVVSDYATFAYLGDVYVEPEWRHQGLAQWLMSCVLAHTQLQGLRRFCLGTRDAHELYKKFGFKVIAQPENWLEIKISNIYQK